MKSIKLFEPLALRGTVLKNRIAVSPMCQYKAVNGHVQPWHIARHANTAKGKAGMVSDVPWLNMAVYGLVLAHG